MTTTQNIVPKEPARTNGPPTVPSRVAPSPDATAPHPLPDLAALTDEALATLVEQGQEEITRRRNKREADFLALVAETARTLGVSPARVAAAIAHKSARPRPAGGMTDGRAVVAAKYRDPADPSRTWSGCGEPPAWITLGEETNPNTGKPLPLRKFWIAEQAK